MFRKLCWVAVGIFFLVMHSPAQTTNGPAPIFETNG
jgi:hypothetical protein